VDPTCRQLRRTLALLLLLLAVSCSCNLALLVLFLQLPSLLLLLLLLLACSLECCSHNLLPLCLQPESRPQWVQALLCKAVVAVVVLACVGPAVAVHAPHAHRALVPCCGQLAEVLGAPGHCGDLTQVAQQRHGKLTGGRHLQGQA
jgi:hypothetical protein